MENLGVDGRVRVELFFKDMEQLEVEWIYLPSG